MREWTDRWQREIVENRLLLFDKGIKICIEVAVQGIIDETHNQKTQ